MYYFDWRPLININYYHTNCWHLIKIKRCIDTLLAFVPFSCWLLDNAGLCTTKAFIGTGDSVLFIGCVLVLITDGELFNGWAFVVCVTWIGDDVITGNGVLFNSGVILIIIGGALLNAWALVLLVLFQ